MRLLPRLRRKARPSEATSSRYSEPGQEQGWEWVLRAGVLTPERKQGYTGPLPESFDVPRQVWN
jgi:hypothetical protein